MSTKTDKELQEQSEALHRRYGARFAGRSRATRDPEEIREMALAAKTLEDEARFRYPSPPAELLSTLRERLELYEKEHREIEAAQAGGPGTRRAAELARAANAVFARYGRHFAGKARSTRDLELLDELISDLQDIREKMQRLQQGGMGALVEKNLQTVEAQHKLYTAEVAEIEAAREALGPDETVSSLGARANEQFALYSNHFAGRPRLSRRPALLERMIRVLGGIRREMVELKASPSSEASHQQNIGIVGERLALWENELGEIRKVRENTSVEELVDGFGAEADAIMQEYGENFAGRDRGTCDPDYLGRLSDRMGEVERQISALDRRIKEPVNRRNLLIVRDSLEMLDKEARLVAEAKGGR